MNLKANVNSSIESIKRKNLFIWRWQTKRYYLGSLYIFILGIVFMYFGISSDFTFKAILVQGGSTIYNLHIGVTIGSALIVIALFTFISIQINRKIFFHDVDRYIKQVGQNEISIIFNDTTTAYFDLMMRQEYKWEKFSGFVYEQGFLLLLTGKKTPTSFIVHENELTQDEFKSLLNFIGTTLRRIK